MPDSKGECFSDCARPPLIRKHRTSIPASQHVLGDMEFRKDLARSIGLDKVPDLDPRAFDHINGILSEY